MSFTAGDSRARVRVMAPSRTSNSRAQPTPHSVHTLATG